jgi:hypothetical protein
MSNRNVAAGLTVLGFRENLDILMQEFRKNAENDYITSLNQQGIDPTTISDKQWRDEVQQRYTMSPKSDIQCIIKKLPDIEWTAPKQDLVDGALFFYLGVTARVNVRRCLREAQTHKEFQKYPALMQSLQESAAFIEKYARTLIGVAKVKSIAVYDNSGAGFRGRNYTKIDSANFHFFEHPLSLDFIKTLPVIINGPTVYSLVGDKSKRIVNELKKTNTLPEWLDNMTFGDTNFSHINAQNWLTTLPQTSIVIDSSVSSSPEQLLRYHFFNYLIKAIADENTPIVEEASHWINNKLSGYSDYVLQINGTWVPFEAKVNVNSERDILEQIKKYTLSESFLMGSDDRIKPTRVVMPKHRICLLGDQHGIYLTVNSQFIDCASDRPLWPRTSLSKALLRDIQKRVAQYL